MKMKKTFIVVAVLILGYGAVSFFKKSGKIEGRTLSVKLVPEYIQSVQASGQLRPRQEVFLTLRKGGQVDSVNGKVNDAVKKGDIIVVVDARTNKANLERAMSRYRFAASEHSRNSRLLSSATGTRQAYEESQNQVNVARSELAEAKQKLEDSIVRSPIDGVISFLPFHVGDFVPDGSRVAVVEDRSSFEMIVRVRQEQSRYFPRTSTVTLRADQRQEVVSSEISLVDLAQKNISRDVDLRVEFKQPIQTFSLRETIEVDIPLEKFQNVAVIPSDYIFDANTSKPRAYFYAGDGTVTFKEINVALSKDGKFIVRDLSNEDRLLLPQNPAQIGPLLGKKIQLKDQPHSI